MKLSSIFYVSFVLVVNGKINTLPNASGVDITRTQKRGNTQVTEELNILCLREHTRTDMWISICLTIKQKHIVTFFVRNLLIFVLANIDKLCYTKFPNCLLISQYINVTNKA
mgnify:CR=1 FL=1